MLASKNAISRKYFQIMHIAIAMHPFHKKYVCIFSTENKVISHQWNRFLLFVNTDYCCWICFCVVFVDFCPTDLFSKMLSYAYLMMKNKNLLVVLSLKFMKKIRIRLSNWTFVLVKKKIKKKKISMLSHCYYHFIGMIIILHSMNILVLFSHIQDSND